MLRKSRAWLLSLLEEFSGTGAVACEKRIRDRIGRFCIGLTKFEQHQRQFKIFPGKLRSGIRIDQMLQVPKAKFISRFDDRAFAEIIPCCDLD